MISFEIWDELTTPARNYEIVARMKLREKYGQIRGQHYIHVRQLYECDGYCDCQLITKDFEHFEIDLEHPRTCDEREPGDGMTYCSVGDHLGEVVGFKELEEDISDGRLPIVLYFESYGGYWESREYHAYLMIGLEGDRHAAHSSLGDRVEVVL